VRRQSALLGLLLLAAGCGGGDGGERSSPAPTPPPASTPAPEQARIQTIATALEVPWEIAFLPDGRALVTERPGRVRLLDKQLRLRSKPVAEVSVSAVGEGGLLGLAIDPDFKRNHFVYLYRTVESGNELARYRFDGDRLVEEATVVTGIRAGVIHDGGRVRFGPDRRLYFTTGDAGDQALAPDRSTLNGKVLRLDPDAYRGRGGRPEVFSFGHRNPQGFDWQPGTGRLVEDEHGPEGNDEINLLRQGANYGWPAIQGDETAPGLVSPIAFYPQSIAPSGATFATRGGSAWTGDYLIGCLVGQQIRRLSLDRSGHVRVNQALFENRFGRLRTVVEGPDGALYVLTSNRDGRGSPAAGDDRIVRIVPPPA
jgi:glucose/arabinose dehydrogenase